MLEKLLEVYRVVVCNAVYLELTENSYPSAELFKSLCVDSKLFISDLEVDSMQVINEKKGLSSLNRGERETIIQFLSGMGDFILLDDGKGARFCFKHQLPFINALLFPAILNFCGRISLDEKDQKISENH